MSFYLDSEQSYGSVSCTVANCQGCSWVHTEPIGKRRYYLSPQVRVPRWAYRLFRDRLRSRGI